MCSRNLPHWLPLRAGRQPTPKYLYSAPVGHPALLSGSWIPSDWLPLHAPGPPTPKYLYSAPVGHPALQWVHGIYHTGCPCVRAGDPCKLKGSRLPSICIAPLSVTWRSTVVTTLDWLPWHAPGLLALKFLYSAPVGQPALPCGHLRLASRPRPKRR